MVKEQNRKKVGEIIAKVRELGLRYKEGAKQFGVKPWLLYDYSRKVSRNAKAASTAASRG